MGIGAILLAAYTVTNYFGGFNFFNAFPEAKQGVGYGALFLIGLLTSVHYVAMCGGINLSQCVSNTTGKIERKGSNQRPGILYNLGRVISYTVIGGLVGALGSVVGFSGTAKALWQSLQGYSW